MAESYSVEAVLSVIDQGFTQAMEKAQLSTKGLGASAKTSSMGVGNMAKAFAIAQVGLKAVGAVFNAVSGTIGTLTSEMNDNQKAWKTFEANMTMVGKSETEIAKVKSSLQDFATQTIYSASDMASTYSQMAAIGVENTEALVKGMGGLAASAENPAQAMKSMSQQMVQAMAQPELKWQDFRIMMDQAPAAMAQVAQQMGYGLDEFIVAIQDGEIASKDFAAAIVEVGNNEHFSNMATEFKTVDQAVDGLTETVANKLMPAFELLSAIAIKAIEGLANWIGDLNFDGVLAPIQALAEMFGIASDGATELTDTLTMTTEEITALSNEWEGMTLSEKQAKLDTMGKADIEELMKLLGVDFESLPDEYHKDAYLNAHGADAFEEVLFLTGEWHNLTFEEKRAVLETQIENKALLEAIESRDLWNEEEFYSHLADIDMSDTDAEQQVLDLINTWAELKGLEPAEVEVHAKTNQVTAELDGIISTFDKVKVAAESLWDMIFGSRSIKDNTDLMAQMGINDKVISIISTVASGVDKVRSALNRFSSLVKGKASKVFEQLTDWFGQIWDVIQQIDFETLIDHLLNFGATAIDAFTDVVNFLLNFFDPIFVKIRKDFDSVIELWRGLVKGFNQALQGDWRGAFDTITSAIGERLVSMASNIFEAWIGIWNNLKALVASIDWLGVGQTIMTAIGIAIAGAIELIGDVGGKIKAWVFETTGSESWEEVGEFILNGIATGISNVKDKVAEIMNEIRTIVSNAIQPILDKYREWADEHPVLASAMEGIAVAIGLISLAFLSIKAGAAIYAAGIAIVTGVSAGLTGLFGGIAAAIALINWPLVLTVIAIGLVIVALYMLWDNWESVTTWMAETLQPVIDMWNDVVLAIQNAINAIKDFFGLNNKEFESTREVQTGINYELIPPEHREIMALVEANLQEMDFRGGQIDVTAEMVIEILEGEGIDDATIQKFIDDALGEGTYDAATKVKPDIEIEEDEGGGLFDTIKGWFSSLGPVKVDAAVEARPVISMAGGTGGGALTGAVGGGLGGSFADGLVGQITAQVQTAMTGANTAASSGMASINATIRSGANTTRATFTQLGTSLTQTMSQVMSSLVSATTSGMSRVVSATRSGMSSVVSALNSAAGAANSAGRNLGMGFHAGLSSTMGSIIALASDIASSAANAIKRGLQIKSPSRVGFYLFEMLGQGLFNGLESMFKPLQNLYGQIVDMVTLSPQSMQYDLNPNVIKPDIAAWNLASQPLPGMTNTNQIYVDTSRLEAKLDQLLAKDSNTYIERDLWVGGTADAYDRRFGQDYNELSGRLLL